MRSLRCDRCGHEWRADPGAGRRVECPRCRETASFERRGNGTVPDSRFDLPTPAVPTAPRSIGDYEILGRLGSGGMGHVFLGRDPRLDRYVAIKLLRSDLFSDASAIERFLREARAAARISHPNVVGILQVALEGGVPFLVMEYVEGETAEGLLERKGRLDLEESLRVLRGALSGLAEVHRQGIVHRDVKPANLLLAADGTVKLTDFGLARMEADGAPLTRSGTLLGTPIYMPPEQWERGPVDARADLYALGVSWYHLLTADHPLPSANPLEIAANLMSGTWVPIEQRRPDLPPGFADVLDRMTRRSADERFASCEDVLAALDAAPGRTRPRFVVRWRSRRKLVGVIAAVALALSVGVVAAVGGRSPEPSVEPDPVVPAKPPPPTPFAPRIVLSTRLPHRLVSRRTDLEGRVESETPVQLLLVGGRQVTLEADGRWRTSLEGEEGQELRVAALAMGGAGQEFEVELWRGTIEARGPECTVTSAPAGPLEAGARFTFQGWATDESGVARVALDGREATREEIGGRTFWSVEWEASGEGTRELDLVAVDQGGRIHRSKVTVAVQAPPAAVEAPPDEAAAPPAENGRRKVGDLVVEEVPVPEGAVGGLAFDPGGTGSLWCASSSGVLVRIDATTLRPVARRELGSGAGLLALCARGLLVAATDLQEVLVLDPASLETTAHHPVPSVVRVASAPSLDVAFAGDARAEELSAIDLATGRVRRLVARTLTRTGREMIGGFGPFEVSPDGRWLFGADSGCLLRYSIEGANARLEEIGPRIASDRDAIEFAADGRLVALLSPGGNSKPDGRHFNTSGYGTYVYEVERLERPVALIQSGAYPNALGHDSRLDLFLAQNHDFQLILFDRSGTKLKEYRLTERSEDVLGFFDDPVRRRVFVCTRRDERERSLRVLAVTLPE